MTRAARPAARAANSLPAERILAAPAEVAIDGEAALVPVAAVDERTEPLAVAVPVLVEVDMVAFVSMTATPVVNVLDIMLEDVWLALCVLTVGEVMAMTVDGRVLMVEAVTVVPPAPTQGRTSM